MTTDTYGPLGPKITDVHAWPLILISTFMAGVFVVVLGLTISSAPSEFMRCLDRADSDAGEAACAQRFPQEHP